MNLSEYEIDIRNLMDNVYMGPQAEVLEEIDEFNEIYIGSRWDQANTKKLGITKKFYWRPGAYDTIRAIIAKKLELEKKACSLSKVVERAREYGNWRMRELWTNVERMESKLFSLRARGTVAQDNTNALIEYWNLIKNKIVEQQELCSNIGGLNDRIEFDIESIYNEFEELLDYKIHVSYIYDELKIHYRDQGSQDDITEINCPGQVGIRISIKLTKLLNLLSSPSANGDLNNIPWEDGWQANRATNKTPYVIGGYYDNCYNLEHPFISRHAHSSPYNSNGAFGEGYSYVCAGNLASEINLCVKSLDFVSLKVYMDRLVSHYDTGTGPLNSIRMSFHGKPNFVTNQEEFYHRIGNQTYNNCTYGRIILDELLPEDVKDESYCSKYCTIKESCNDYLEAVRPIEPMSREEIERQELERITINAARRIQ
tara:strand:+ start:1145 stop:2425 length:1281 start_codon:yes stop_codon:yes gene_type:complete